MPERDGKRIPPWAERERGRDLAWIQENVHIFFPAAQQGFAESGRGAIVSDTTTLVQHEGGLSNLFAYMLLDVIEERRWQDVIRMVKAYEPDWEFVCVLLKQDRESAYRVGVPAQKEKLP
jgi:hypothetical protein